MLFNSPVFMFVFLPITVCGYFFLGHYKPWAAAVWLAAASAVFYSYWNPPFILVLATSITTNYGLLILIRHFEGRPGAQSATLAFAVAINLLALFYFKYLFSLLDWLNSFGVRVPHFEDSVALPLGISFFTFTQLGYLIDAKAGSIKDHGLLNYILFVTFFPHLIAGPILHHREMMPQFSRPDIYRLNVNCIASGTVLFVIGLAKKSFIADRMAPIVVGTFGHPETAPLTLAWLAVLAYSLQLYFDFSGYSDMAIGLARIFGIRFPLNFISPYKAASIIDFWQRWHMTLTRYLTSYLYNPAVLFVTRRRLARGLPVSRSATATLRGFGTMIAVPLFYTMILAGIWHGAGLQYVVFGLLHGCYLTINHAYRVFRPHSYPKSQGSVVWLRSLLGIAITYLAVLVAQVFFRANSVADAVRLLESMFGLHGFKPEGTLSAAFGGGGTVWIFQFLLAFVIVWALPNSNEILERYEQVRFHPAVHGIFFAGLMMIILVAASGPPVQFLYFQF
jgi:alginate O-acetyltransferase complex protein AlgI